jgi:hypothetical protein
MQHSRAAGGGGGGAPPIEVIGNGWSVTIYEPPLPICVLLATGQTLAAANNEWAKAGVEFPFFFFASRLVRVTVLLGLKVCSTCGQHSTKSSSTPCTHARATGGIRMVAKSHNHHGLSFCDQQSSKQQQRASSCATCAPAGCMHACMPPVRGVVSFVKRARTTRAEPTADQSLRPLIGFYLLLLPPGDRQSSIDAWLLDDWV